LTYFRDNLEAGEVLAVSVVTVAEVMRGLRPDEMEATDRLLALFVILEVDELIARQAGAYLREFRRTHQLDLGDALIAATAMVRDAELITRNVKHYPMKDISVTVPYERGRRS
jgi:predicted nucleic acid-binding protein